MAAAGMAGRPCPPLAGVKQGEPGDVSVGEL